MPPHLLFDQVQFFGFILILNFLEIGTRGGGLFLLFIMEALPS